MHFNKNEIASLVRNPKTKFDKEGRLIFTTKRFFKSADVSDPCWCKLRGNLLFYLKDEKPNSTIVGIIVLENCTPIIYNETPDHENYYSFVLEYESGYSEKLSTQTHQERLDWIEAIKTASYKNLNQQIASLQEQLYLKMGNTIEAGIPYPINAQTTTAPNIDVKYTNNQNIAEEGDLITF